MIVWSKVSISRSFGLLILCLLGAVLLLVAMGVPAGLAQEALLIFGAGVLVVVGKEYFSVTKTNQRLLEEHAASLRVFQRQQSESRNAIDDLANGLQVAILICDSKFQVIYANEHASRMFKFEDPIGRSVLAVTLSYDLESLLKLAFKSREPQNTELALAYPEQRINLASAWVDETGEHAFLAIYEITDLRRLERIRQDFVANVSHELRTPLATIRAMAETLQDNASRPELIERYLVKVISEVDRLSLITNDLLILTAAESNTVRKNICDIAEAFASVVQQLRPKAEMRNISLEYKGSSKARIEANSAQMTQVALNLVDNAINYTVEGSVVVSVKVATDVVVIEVEDTGLGIASEQLPRIFERFYRVDRGRSRQTGGTGLGLSIVKHIVEAHGGTVEVQSALNEGSCFRVTLPIGDITLAPSTESSQDDDVRLPFQPF